MGIIQPRLQYLIISNWLHFLLNVLNDPKRSFEVIFGISEIMFRLSRNDRHLKVKFQPLLLAFSPKIKFTQVT